MHLSVLYDDGAAVYINGTEVFRENLAPGADYHTFADASVGDGLFVDAPPLPASLLHGGTNVVAVEVHQVNSTSSDMSMDLILQAVSIAPQFGTITPNVGTGFEEALPGDTFFNRTAGNTELAWTMTGTAAIAEVDMFTDPNDPSNLHQFHVSDGEEDEPIEITTELIDLRGYGDVEVSLDLRTWDTRSGFEESHNDGYKVSLFTSLDGVDFVEIPWLAAFGPDAAVANTGAQNGPFDHYVTTPGLIPDDAVTMRVVLTLNTNSDSEHIMLDNLRIATGTTAPNALFWDEQGDGNWRDLDPQTEFSRWVDHLGNHGPVLPRHDTPVIVRTDTVTVAANRNAESLVVQSGKVLISEHATLTLSDSLRVLAGASLAFDVADTSTGNIAAAGDVQLSAESLLTLEIDGASPFKAGTYTLITAGGNLTGTFDQSSGLGHYADTGIHGDGLTYTDHALTLTIDKDLHPGDADLSGVTDLTDFNIWNATKFATGTDWTAADFNGDGTTDLSDFNLWNANKFTLAGGGTAPAPTEVPEPGTLLLACIAAIVLCGLWRWVPHVPVYR